MIYVIWSTAGDSLQSDSVEQDDDSYSSGSNDVSHFVHVVEEKFVNKTASIHKILKDFNKEKFTA